jgi:hypothetical protein
MPDYFTRLSFELRCSKTTADLFATACQHLLKLADASPSDGEVPLPDELAVYRKPVENPERFPSHLIQWAFLLDAFEDIDLLDVGITAIFDETDGKLWISDDEGRPNIDALARLLQIMLPEALPTAFDWSYDCSRPQPHAFGGGWCLITRGSIHFETTQGRLEQALRAVQDVASPAPVPAASASEKSWQVGWEIQLDGNDPMDIADQARTIQQDPDSIATLFEVRDADGIGTLVDVATRTLTPLPR